MGVVYVVRHGQASFGAADYDQLSPLGEEQSRVLGASFAARGIAIDVALSGTLKRHRQTADACLSALPATISRRETAALDEFDPDDLVARYEPRYIDRQAIWNDVGAASDPRAAFETIFEGSVARWIGGAYDSEYRESWSAFRRRCVGAIEELVATPGASRTALVFTSGGPIAALIAEYGKLPDDVAMRLVMGLCNASVTKLVYGRRGILLASYNEQSHFESAAFGKRLLTYR